ncbi:MAG: hypothetical protein CM1200mP10_03360 [Candidatus Neomarinimicrobiota bacterium]|nr:MAG: hypothetical protein CM1200mP10_03360 [Candidatus Neomarinimicrobiota bacterium]
MLALDLFDVRAELGIAASKNEVRSGGKPKETAKRYRHYTELLENKDIDAVIVSTPDHWHSRLQLMLLKQGNMFIVKKD